ncbi:MAG TPA: hypothetical protein VNK52_02825, partial [Hyphomicrobiaceae bacterium]|nr:hypothetical protein [Hyphomicrobiaceae bacterium]
AQVGVVVEAQEPQQHGTAKLSHRFTTPVLARVLALSRAPARIGRQCEQGGPGPNAWADAWARLTSAASQR